MHTNVNASQHAQYIYILNKSHHFHISAVFLHAFDIFDLVTTPTKKKVLLHKNLHKVPSKKPVQIFTIALTDNA